MKIEVVREGVCAADDQTGSLEKVIKLRSDATVADLTQKIEESNFLQFSSTHSSMVGYANELPIVRIYCPYHTGKKAEFLVNKYKAISEVLEHGVLSFKF